MGRLSMMVLDTFAQLSCRHGRPALRGKAIFSLTIMATKMPFIREWVATRTIFATYSR